MMPNSIKSHRIDIPKYFSAGFSGILLTGAFPNVDWHGLAWFALVPLMVALRKLKFKSSFALGWTCGMVHYLTLIYWIAYTMRVYGYLPWGISIPVLVLFAAYLALFVGLFAVLVTLFSHKSLRGLIAIPIAWVSLEYIRSVLFTGFPWELIGHSQYMLLPINQIADIFGVYGVSCLVVAINLVICLTYLYLTKKDWQHHHITKRLLTNAWIAALFLVAATLGYGFWRLHDVSNTAAQAPAARVAVVQGNIPQSIKWDPEYQIATLKKYFHLSQKALKSKPDLIVWPETAAPFYFHRNAKLTAAVTNAINHFDTVFLIGSPSVTHGEKHATYYNSAYLLVPRQSDPAVYHKSHLVPFGEYVPLKKWLPFLGKIVAQVGDFSRGKPGDTVRWGESQLGILICYELIFPYLARAAAQNGANVLVNMTNDAWYGRTGAPYQHFSMAVFRAIENRRTLVRSANTGISGFIDPAGRIQSTTALFEDAIRVETIPLFQGLSIYTQYGDFFAIFCVMAVGLLSAWQLLWLMRRRP